MDTEIPARPTRASLGEIATTADGMDITRYTGGQLLWPTDEVLRQRGGGLDLTIYKQVLSDPKCYSSFAERRSAVTSAEWDVEPASDRRVDKRAAEYVKQQLRHVGLDRITDLMLYSIWYGYGVAEWIYEIRDGLIGLAACKVRDRRRFRFAPDGSLRMLTRSRMADGIELDLARFWTLSVGADHDDEPYGTGLGHWCYWPSLFKRQGLSRWLTFLDRFAQPVAVGKYDPNIDDDSGTQRQRLLAALRAIRTDSGVALPEGMAITLLEASRSGTPDYETLQRMLNDVLAQVIVGQTMTSSDGSSRSQAEVHLSVRGDIVKADADLGCESLNRTLVTWLTRWNFAGAEPPRLYRKLDPPSDLDKQAEREERISRIGYRPTLQHVKESYGGEWEPVASPPPQTATSPYVPGAPAVATPVVELADGADDATSQHRGCSHEFADGADVPDRVEQIADKLTAESEPAWREIIDLIEARVEAATSLPALRDELLALWPSLPRERLTAALGAALAAADGVGRIDVDTESEAEDGQG
jgi:phage gp29-like protein